MTILAIWCSPSRSACGSFASGHGTRNDMKAYEAKTISGAQNMVRQLRRQIEERNELLKEFDHQRRLLARLAADSPQFYNPLDVAEAKRIRDKLLD